MIKLSVVTSLYNSEPYIAQFHAKYLDCISKLGVDYEFIFVNDGSPDDSANVVKQIIGRHPQVKLINLSRNFGQTPAMFAGLAFAAGDYIYAADCDLEEDPENLLAMFKVIRSNPDIDVVYGVIAKRAAGIFVNTLSAIFYYILNLLSEVRIPHNQTWQRIMTAQYVQELLRYQEVRALPIGLMALVGFNQQPLLVTKSFKGATSYSLLQRSSLALSTIVSFSTKPLSWVCIIGFAMAATSFAFIAILCLAKLLQYDFQVGWSSLIASIWCIGGLILLSIGIVGTYLARVFEQVKSRPRYIVKHITTAQTLAADTNTY